MPANAAQIVYGWRKLASGSFIDPEQYCATHINDAIASADRFSNWARKQADGTPNDPSIEQADKYQNLSRLLGWFRDKLDCTTMGDILSSIRSREIDLSIIDFWAHEYFQDKLPPCVIKGAVIESYPEVAVYMQEQQEKATAACFARIRGMIEGA